MIDYSESGWVWDGDINTGNNTSIILNKSRAAIFPKKNGFNDGNIQLLIEKGINEKSRVNVRLIDKYDFSIEVLNGKKIDLINHILNYIRDNRIDMNSCYNSELRSMEPRNFAEISIAGGTPIFFSNKPIQKRIPNWKVHKPRKSYIIQLSSIILEDIEKYELKNGRAVLPCTFGMFFSIRQENNYITTKSKYHNFKLDVDYSGSDILKNILITNTSLDKVRNISSVIDGEEEVDKIRIIGNFIPRFKNKLVINSEQNHVFGLVKSIRWERKNADKIILDNSDIINPKLIWKFKDIETGREIKNIEGDWVNYVNNLDLSDGIGENINPKIYTIEKSLFPLEYYKKNLDGNIEKLIAQRYCTTINTRWSYDEMTLHLELKKQDWSEGTEEILNESFTLTTDHFKNIKDEDNWWFKNIEEGKKWFNNKIKYFWMQGNEEDKMLDSRDKLHWIIIQNFVQPCKVFLQNNNYEGEITLDSFRNPEKAYSWPFKYIISIKGDD